MPRQCKISQLSKPVREELNRRLAGRQAGAGIVAWLNSQPEVEALLEPVFQGHPINEQNLSAWRRGGYVEWEVRQDCLSDADEIAEAGGDYAATGLAAGHFMSCLKGRLASNLRAWDGTPHSQHLHNIQILQRLCTGFLRMRRSEQQDERRTLDRDRLEFAHEKESRRPATPPKPSKQPPTQDTATTASSSSLPPIAPFRPEEPPAKSAASLLPVPPKTSTAESSSLLSPVPHEALAAESSSSSSSSSSLDSLPPTTPVTPTTTSPSSTQVPAHPPKAARPPIPIPPPSTIPSEPPVPPADSPAPGEPTLTNPSLQANTSNQQIAATPSIQSIRSIESTPSTQSPPPSDNLPLDPEIQPSTPSAQPRPGLTLFGVPIKKLIARLTPPYDRYLPFASARQEAASAESASATPVPPSSPTAAPPSAAVAPCPSSAPIPTTPAEPTHHIYRRPPPDPVWLRAAIAAFNASWPEDPPPVEDENDPTLRYTL